ncbi:hypothetical protein C8J56DRAFT_1119733 [Mycena floridula]|nr:hypothetical protein C8J56DRAFT_1119733 [Mycena floridula]
MTNSTSHLPLLRSTGYSIGSKKWVLCQAAKVPSLRDFQLKLENESNVDSKTGQSASVSNGLSTVSSSSTPESLSKSTLASSSCRFLTTLGRTTLLTLLVGGGWFIWTTQQDKHPGQQLPFEEGKKTLVALGSGWGTTSLLKTLDTEDYNVIVMSPKNVLFAPLLPSIAVGTLSPRSILQPTRYLTRHKKRGVAVIDAEATKVDAENRTVTFADKSEIQGSASTTTIPYD